MTEFTMKDSGKREHFDSGAVRDTRDGKGRFDLVSFLALDRYAKVLERGAAKYAARNWESGMPISRCVDSAMRHLGQFMLGQSDEDHLGQAAWNLMSALHFDEGIKRGIYPTELDDRPRYKQVPQQPDDHEADVDQHHHKQPIERLADAILDQEVETGFQVAEKCPDCRSYRRTRNNFGVVRCWICNRIFP